MLGATPSRWLLALAVALCATTAGCLYQENPPEVLVTPIGEAVRAARGPGCNMPILHIQPTRTYREIAIVEGWGALDQGAKVDAEVRNKACQTGADALLIVSAKRQKDIKDLYAATPNTTQQAVGGEGASAQTGAYIHRQEYRPEPGEAGHNGYYFDGLAIIYTDHLSANGKIASGDPQP